MNYDDYYSDNNSLSMNNNINSNNNYNNNIKPPINKEHIQPKNKKRKIIRIVSIFILFLVVVYIVLMILSYMKIIRLPWIDYPEVLNLSQSEVVLKKNGTYQLSSTVFPSQIPYGRILYSSSDPSVVSVNQITGYVEAKKNGVATITAKLEDYGDILDTCEVVVSDNNIFIERIIINNESINLVVGKEYTISYSYEPNNATVHSFSYTSSNDDVAKVSETGVITALGQGEAIVTVTDISSGVSAEQRVSVFDSQKVEKVEVSNSSITLTVDGTIQLTATVKPETVNQSITWSSVDPKVATVTSTGLVKGVNYGSTKIIATAVDGTNAVIDVTVQEKEIKVEGVSINEDKVSINEGMTKRLVATIKPSSATNQGVTWSTDAPTVVAVNSNGDVKGLKAGIATVTVKTLDGGYIANATIVVKQVQSVIKETDIKLETPKTALFIGKSITVKAEVLPKNATYKDLSWSSSNESIATVSNGTIYGKGAGMVTIKATSHNGLSKTLTIVVSAIPVSSIKLSDSSRKINIGEEYSLVATITPADATNKTIKWASSDDSILSVNDKGLVVPHKVGHVTITATTSNGKTANCKFEVRNDVIMPTSVSISRSQVEIKGKGTIGLTAVVQPSNATNQKIAWDIENPHLAIINEQGIVTGLSDGVTRVTATTINGKTATAFIVIKSNNNTKYNYLNGSTIKYWIENNTSKNAYITHIWVNEASNQFATMIPSKMPGLETATQLMNKVANKYQNETVIAVNASSFVNYNYNTGSGWNSDLAKSDKRWNHTVVTPIVIYEGVVKRDFTSEKMANNNHIVYGLRKDNLFSYYTYYNGSDIEANKATTQMIKDDGIKYTFGFHPVLVRSNKSMGSLKNNKDIRQAICQIDRHNFIIYTTANDNRNQGFGFQDLANLMVKDQCITGFNLDGGGSRNLLYKKKNTKSVIGIKTTSRAIADIIYFHGE